jgi:hypothetical protein
MPRMETIDFRKTYKELYRAKEAPQELVVPAGVFLGVDGAGEPGGAEYQAAIEALYSVAYTMKFALRGAGDLDFKIPNLECLWLSNPDDTPPPEWEWRLQIRVPEEIDDGTVADAIGQVRAKKGIDTSTVRRVARNEGRAIQVLHVGPYDRVGDSYRKLGAYAKEYGLELESIGHEVYLNDPRRTAPEKLKTIVRMPVRSS